MPEQTSPQPPEPVVDLAPARSGWRIVPARTGSLALPPLSELDPRQREIAQLGPGSGPRFVLGAPGTGRTTALLALAARQLREGLPADRLLVLSPSRASAARARDALTATAATTMSSPPVRAWQAYAFDLLRRAQAEGLLPGVSEAPQLMSGPEQDVLIKELLDGHRRGHGAAVVWPPDLSEAVGTRGFRHEIRDLFDRVSEHGLSPDGLEELGRSMDRPDWVAAAALRREYLRVRRLRMPEAFDPAGLVSEASRVLEAHPDFRDREQQRLELVVADDLQEATPSIHRLLEVLCRGRDVVVAASPDTVVQGFRGARPDLLRGLEDRLGTAQRPVGRHVLGTGHRMPAGVQLAWQRTAERIPAIGGARDARRPAPAAPWPAQPPVEPSAAPAAGAQEDAASSTVAASPRPRAAILASASQEARWIGHAVLQRHLLEDVPLQDMAVVVRSSDRLQSLERHLTALGIPVTTSAAETPVRDESAVKPLLAALRLIVAERAEAAQEDAEARTGGAPGAAAPLEAEEAVELLSSRIGGASAMDLRRLRQRLRAHELRSGGGRSSDRLLVEALLDPTVMEDAGVRAAPARRVSRMLQAGRTALRAESATAETVLWALWEASGVAGRWQRAALAGGPEGQRADRDLDAVVALFGTAERFVDHRPGAGPQEFLDFLEHQDLPMDTLAARAPAGDSVEIMTPATAAGRGWPVVFIAGVQDGRWPNTTLRGQLLGAQLLSEAVELGPQTAARSSPAARLAEVRHDELRQFATAVSRCSRELIVTAVSGPDDEPSEFVDLVDPWDPAVHPEAADAARPVLAAPRPPTLRALTAELRSALTRDSQPPARRRAAAGLLHRFAASPESVPGASPDTWWGLLPLSSTQEVLDPEQPVPLSPSRIETIQRSPLDWYVSTARAEEASDASRSVGTLVHAIAEEHPEDTGDQLVAELDRRWRELGLPDTWESDLLKERAETMVRRFAEYVIAARKDEHRRLVLVEGGFEVLIHGRARDALLRGRVDRLEIDAQGRYVVVDLKTGRSAPAGKDLPDHPQLLAYQTALAAGAGDAMARRQDRGHDSEDQPEAEAPLVLPEGPLRHLPGGALLVQLGKDTAKVSTQLQDGLGVEDGDRVRELVTAAADLVAGDRFLAGHAAGSGGRFGGLGCRIPEICPLCAEGRQVTE
ncbi:UrvD/REP family ATP-dependent DNA helicase [Kocuria palustris]|uniref:UrvD/REP family ATP-dependent DNA helicase n=1 Tax=Kocuria palustris TaxID=71999 RepID=UPI0011A73C16|nr:UrvD/REP family ATP-dependent DNA helicase [Kocuria palustris]